MTIMEILLKKIILLVAVILLFVGFGCNSEKQTEDISLKQESLHVNSSEYKLLLNPSKFDNYESAFAAYWQIVQEVAEKEGLPILPSENPLELKQKHVSFFDTKNLDLYKSGFRLRKRTKYKKGKEVPGNEYTLKYIRSSAKEALAVDLTLGEGYMPKDDEIELESDILYYSAENGSRKTIYTLANATVIETQLEMTIGAFSNIFPVLKKFEVPSNTEIKKVAGVSAIEWKASLGEIDFGNGLKAEMDLVIWIIDAKSGQIIIPEFSFDHGYKNETAWDNNSMNKCKIFMEVLRDAKPEWVIPGRGKSAKLFELEKGI